MLKKGLGFYEGTVGRNMDTKVDSGEGSERREELERKPLSS
jgi:hypothetical protein